MPRMFSRIHLGRRALAQIGTWYPLRTGASALRLIGLLLLIAFATTAVYSKDAPQAPTPIRPASERFAEADTREVADFRRHVSPILGRLGCNGRACHGSFQGQGGFRLSLFGYDFRADHEALMRSAEPRV